MRIMKVRAVANGVQDRDAGVRGISAFWSLQDLETEQYIKKGLLGCIKLVSQTDATKWKDVGKMVRWAQFGRDDLEVVDDLQQ